jgi:hypothetical protein
LGSFAVIVLDTHIWVWWVHAAPQLPPAYLAYIQANEPQGTGYAPGVRHKKKPAILIRKKQFFQAVRDNKTK